MSLDDKTRAELQEIAGRYPQARSALLPMLHLVQSIEGSVTAEGIDMCADLLGLSHADVSGVATFYTMYKRRPMGEHHVGVCTNTLCAVMGGDAIFERLNAACDFAPVMTVNWEFFDNQTPQSAVELVDALRAGDTVRATRGATITSWREAERVLAGFEDGLVDEGPAAAGPSLIGLEIARDRGWEAPPLDGAGGTTTTVATESAEAAAEESDTSRAETETKIEESPADTSEEGDDD